MDFQNLEKIWRFMDILRRAMGRSAGTSSDGLNFERNDFEPHTHIHTVRLASGLTSHQINFIHRAESVEMNLGMEIEYVMIEGSLFLCCSRKDQRKQSRLWSMKPHLTPA